MPLSSNTTASTSQVRRSTPAHQPPLAPPAPNPPNPAEPAGTMLMLFALMLPSASRVPVTVMVSLSCRSEAWPTTVLRTMTLWSNVTLTSMLQRASWTVRLLPVRLVTVPVAPRRAAAPLALADGDALGDGQAAASPRPPAKPLPAVRPAPVAVGLAALAVPPPPILYPP